MQHPKLLVAGLSLSAAALIGLATQEGYVGEAMIPTKNDRPTIGYGSTFHEDGTPVKLGDVTTPVRALVKLKAHVDKEEAAFRKSLDGAYLSQIEFDQYMDFVYNFGIGNWLGSSMRKHVQAGRYSEACQSLLLYKRAGGRDCSLPENWGPKGCRGVWTRQLERVEKCMAAQ